MGKEELVNPRRRSDSERGYATLTLWDGVFGEGGINPKHRKMQQMVVRFRRVMTCSCSNLKKKKQSSALQVLYEIIFNRPIECISFSTYISHEWTRSFSRGGRRLAVQTQETCESLWVQLPKRNSTSLGAIGSVCACHVSVHKAWEHTLSVA